MSPLFHGDNSILSHIPDAIEAEDQQELMNIGEKALWQSVIMQAVLDTMNNSKRTSEKVAKNASISWFSMENHDFLEVCTMAEMEPQYIINNVKILMNKEKSTTIKPRTSPRAKKNKQVKEKKQSAIIKQFSAQLHSRQKAR